jgi:hypothetical protein
VATTLLAARCVLQAGYTARSGLPGRHRFERGLGLVSPRGRRVWQRLGGRDRGSGLRRVSEAAITPPSRLVLVRDA